jgi:hypothetical protein
MTLADLDSLVEDMQSAKKAIDEMPEGKKPSAAWLDAMESARHAALSLAASAEAAMEE